MALASNALLATFVLLLPWAVILTIFAFVTYDKDGKSFAAQWVAIVLDVCVLLTLQCFFVLKIIALGP